MIMPMFRKKPVVIEAVQWTGDRELMNDFMGVTDSVETANHGFIEMKELYIKTLEGIHKANLNDWVIRGVKGEFYPCKPDIFEQTYEKVE